MIMKILIAGAVCPALIGTAFADEDAKFAASVQGGTLGIGVEGQYKLSQAFVSGFGDHKTRTGTLRIIFGHQ